MTDTELIAEYTAAFRSFRAGRHYQLEPGERLPLCRHCFMARLDHIYVEGTQGEYKCPFLPMRFKVGCYVEQSDKSWDVDEYSYRMVLEDE